MKLLDEGLEYGKIAEEGVVVETHLVAVENDLRCYG